MVKYDAARVFEILANADEQVNIFAGGRNHVEWYHLPIVLDIPEDWLAWLLHDADLHETMANDQRYPDFDQARYWEDAALMRKFAISLLLAGVKPTEFEWNEEFY